ncbi:MAG: hypothetical protein ACSHX4_00205 [Opitutaceae bacterium]
MDKILILRLAPSGESFLKMDVLSPEHGTFLCLKRISKKSAQQTTPDLFDTADIQLETSKQGTARFVREYQLLNRRETIGRSYHSLRHASEFSALIARNGPHMAEPEALFELVERTLNAFAEGKAPEVVHLKAVYMLLKNEGYPIRESWWPSLPSALRDAAKTLINEPAPEQPDAATREDCEKISQRLYRWLEHETDLR